MFSQSCDHSTNHIWQYKDLDSNTTSICYVDKKEIGDVDFFISKVKDIESETKCLINLHGAQNKNGIVWLRIKNQCQDLRSFAILLINSYTKNSCKEIVLPKMSQKNASNTKKKTLTRSCTENSIGCGVSSSNPFGSILTPFREENSIEISKRMSNEQEMNLSNNQINSHSSSEEQAKKENRQSTKQRYTLDFLLARSTMPESKKLPRNWKQLNVMYPNICFVGTVLSYFNASKYYDHWIRIQNENPELHNPVETLTNIQYLNLSQDKQSSQVISRRNYPNLINGFKNNPEQINSKSKTKTYALFTNETSRVDFGFFSAQNKSQKNSKKLFSN